MDFWSSCAKNHNFFRSKRNLKINSFHFHAITISFDINFFLIVKIRIEGNASSLLCFDYFNENFTGQSQAVTYCLCCETHNRGTPVELIDLIVPLTSPNMDENFIEVRLIFLIFQFCINFCFSNWTTCLTFIKQFSCRTSVWQRKSWPKSTNVQHVNGAQKLDEPRFIQDCHVFWSCNWPGLTMTWKKSLQKLQHRLR